MLYIAEFHKNGRWTKNLSTMNPNLTKSSIHCIPNDCGLRDSSKLQTKHAYISEETGYTVQETIASVLMLLLCESRNFGGRVELI